MSAYGNEIQDFLRDGYVIIRNLLSREETKIVIQAAHADRDMLDSAFELADTAGSRIRLSGWNYAGDDTLRLVARLPRIVDHSGER